MAAAPSRPNPRRSSAAKSARSTSSIAFSSFWSVSTCRVASTASSLFCSSRSAWGVVRWNRAIAVFRLWLSRIIFRTVRFVRFRCRSELGCVKKAPTNCTRLSPPVTAASSQRDDAERAQDRQDERRAQEDHAPRDQELIRPADRVVDADRAPLCELLVLPQLLALVCEHVLPVLEVVLVAGEAVGGDDRRLVALRARAAEKA